MTRTNVCCPFCFWSIAASHVFFFFCEGILVAGLHLELCYALLILGIRLQHDMPLRLPKVPEPKVQGDPLLQISWFCTPWCRQPCFRIAFQQKTVSSSPAIWSAFDDLMVFFFLSPHCPHYGSRFARCKLLLSCQRLQVLVPGWMYRFEVNLASYGEPFGYCLETTESLSRWSRCQAQGWRVCSGVCWYRSSKWVSPIWKMLEKELQTLSNREHVTLWIEEVGGNSHGSEPRIRHAKINWTSSAVNGSRLETPI